jgi:hypothetical protein
MNLLVNESLNRTHNNFYITNIHMKFVIFHTTTCFGLFFEHHQVVQLM